MSFKQSLSAELPYLRRYARAITGSQQLGDAAVREMLEALLASPDIFDTGGNQRVELYRVFHKLWQPVITEFGAETSATAALAPEARRVLMLSSVEGFDFDEVATILGESRDTIETWFRLAQGAVTDQLATDVLVIEDEAIIALHIQSIVKELGHDVVGIARTHGEAVALAKDTGPSLVLADISLADGTNGIDAVREILEFIDVPVIFVTAFPERLLTGFGLEPTYLITKPFEPGVLTATIAQALMFHRESTAYGDRAAAA